MAEPPANAASERLRGIRDRIDEIDDEIARLLNERANCAIETAEIKVAESGGGKTVYYRPEREAQVFARLRAANAGPLSNRDVERLFRTIISCCRALEQPLTIAFLGPHGTYSEAAAREQFGAFVRTRALASVDEVFREVEAEAAHYGVVPVENSTEGMVNHTLDCFIGSPLSICAEIELPIHHAFMVARGADQAALEAVCSHQQSLAQCRRWLDANYPGLARRPVASNAEAARMAAETKNVAAIAGEMAAERYSLDIVHTNIEDEADNKTRFLVVGDQDVPACGSDRTSIIVSTRNAPGALYSVLEPFNRHGISLSRVETRPSRGSNWTYVFFIDFEGHKTDAPVAAALAEVEEVAVEVKLLGSYPRSPGQ
ncbi:MAG: prephenate dehydratase [Gammaproteobacteria bacterium]|nr:prephenate dehydratase [Gammaproteobacteria bacterium]MYB37203.1 prephenate dehydratase [Gammaproteobacteria bacterium]